MATYQSRDELVSAYKELIEIENKIHSLLSPKNDLNLDKIQTYISRQSTIIAGINEASDLQDDLLAKSDSGAKELIEKFCDLREQTRAVMKKMHNKIGERLDSLDTSSQLMRHYMQGKKRDEEISSLRIDDNF